MPLSTARITGHDTQIQTAVQDFLHAVRRRFDVITVRLSRQGGRHQFSDARIPGCRVNVTALYHTFRYDLFFSWVVSSDKLKPGVITW